MNNIIPICYFPTQVMMIDDDQAFSQSVSFKLHRKNFRLMHDPKTALHFLNGQYQSTVKKEDFLIKKNMQQEITIQKIKSLITEKQTQNEISLLMVDYHMPEMTGLELLAQVHQPQLKKILITSETDYKIAVNAFNQGLIHAYVRKDEPDFIEQLARMIKKLEWQYFVDITLPIFNIADYDFSYLQDANVFELFCSNLETHAIQAFCMINPAGDFLLINKENKKSYFIVRNQEQLNELAFAARDDGASHDVVEQIAQRKAIPFFGEEKNYWEIPAKEWSPFLLPSRVLNDTWSLVFSE